MSEGENHKASIGASFLRVLSVPILGAPWVVMVSLGVAGLVRHHQSATAWLLGLLLILAGLRALLGTVWMLFGGKEPRPRGLELTMRGMALAAKVLLLMSGGWIACSGQGQSSYVLLGCAIACVAVLLLLWGRLVGLAKHIATTASSRRRDKEAPPMNQVAVLAADGLSFGAIAPHFRRLSEHDALALAEPDFLSWKSEQSAEIHVSRCGSEDWIAVFWGRTGRRLSARILSRFCTAQGVELPQHFAHAEPDGVVLYREGSLVIYPEAEARAFMSDYGDSLLCSDAVFAAWLEDYTS